MSSSSSTSNNPFAMMMESVALNESRVIVEDIDYVLVDEPQQNNTARMELDDDSYDYCEDVVSMLSVEQPSSLSVCSDLPSIDLGGMEATKEQEPVTTKPERRPRVISFGNDEDELQTRTGKFEFNIEPLDEQMSEEVQEEASAEESVATPVAAEQPEEAESPTDEKMSESEERIETIAEQAMQDMKPTISTSRLSNKKRRKKMKLMKRAAAAAAAAAALSEMTAYHPTAPTLPAASPKRSRKAKKSNRPRNSVAVACAMDTMEAYRQEVANKKKGSSKFVAPMLTDS